MYVPEGMCYGGTRRKPLTTRGLFCPQNRHMIPRNDALTVSSHPPD